MTGNTDYALENLGVQLVVSRVRLMTWDRKEPSIQKAIETVHEFFVKNASQAQRDLITILERTP